MVKKSPCQINQFMNHRPLTTTTDHWPSTTDYDHRSLTTDHRSLTTDHWPLTTDHWKSHFPATVKVVHNSLDRSKVKCLQSYAPDKLTPDFHFEAMDIFFNFMVALTTIYLETDLILRNVGSVSFGDRLKKDDPICLKKTSIFKLQ